MDRAKENQLVDAGDPATLLSMYQQHFATLTSSPSAIEVITLWCKYEDSNFIEVSSQTERWHSQKNSVAGDNLPAWVNSPFAYRWCETTQLPAPMRVTQAKGCLVGARNTGKAVCILIAFIRNNEAADHTSAEAAFEHYLTHLHRAFCIGQLEAQQQQIKNLQQKLSDNDSMATLGEMVGAVTHEINNPLGVAITGLSHLQCEVERLVKDFDNGDLTETSFGEFIEECTDCCQLLEFNLHRAANLIQGFKKTAVDQSAHQKYRFDVGENIRNLMLSLTPEIKRRGITLDMALPEHQVLADGYPGALSQIITNLTFNAMRHAFEYTSHPRIRVVGELHLQQNTFRVVFEDNGCGIKPDIQRSIFDRYFTTQTDCGGSGLGMSIAKDLAEHQLGGSLSLDTAYADGARFVITLPLTL